MNQALRVAQQPVATGRKAAVIRSVFRRYVDKDEAQQAPSIHHRFKGVLFRLQVTEEVK